MDLGSNSEFINHYEELLHEIKSPIDIIRAHAKHLKDNYMRDEVSIDEYLSIIIDETERLYLLLRNIEESVKKVNIRPSLCDINCIIKDVISKLKHEISDKDVTIRFSPDSEMPKIYIDVSKLYQVLINLIKNAVRSVEPGGEVEIKAEADERLKITVKDNGCGIKSSDLDRIFEPFFTTAPGGTGLGLFIVNKIIDAHGGKLEVSSVCGEGSEFLVTLPIQSDKRADNE